MSRVNDTIAKYGLRDICEVRGVRGQKMDEACIQKFVDGDPSGNGKYLDWMLLMAGGGDEALQKSINQWEKGEYGDPPLRTTVREHYIEEAVAGYLNDENDYVAPVTEAVAIRNWETTDEKFYRLNHIYGDEEYSVAGFGFYRSWPGRDAVYVKIVHAVARFHRYQEKLKSEGHPLDLSPACYPTLRSLQEALGSIAFLELKNDVDFDIVYADDYLVVVCPFNIGASLKYGHHKWCTSNETMTKTACSGQGPNRWREYAKDAALYYCRILSRAGDACFDDEPEVTTAYRQIAIQAPFNQLAQMRESGVRPTWRYYDTLDAGHTDAEITERLQSTFGAHVKTAFASAKQDVLKHFYAYPMGRLKLDFVISQADAPV